MMYDGEGNAWPEIAPPIISAPPAGLVSALLGFTLNALPFVGADSHARTSWEIRTAPGGGGTVAWSSSLDLGLLSKIVPVIALSGLLTGQTYYIRARFHGATYVSDWSADVRITT